MTSIVEFMKDSFHLETHSIALQPKMHQHLTFITISGCFRDNWAKSFSIIAKDQRQRSTKEEMERDKL